MNKPKGKSIDVKNLNWKKDENYIDRFSEVISISLGERSVIIDFGVFEEEGKIAKDEGLSPNKPYISNHTRIRVSPQHFIVMVEVFKSQIDLLKEINKIEKPKKKGGK